jgi:hypothetical protein
MLATNGEYHLTSAQNLSIGYPLWKAATQIAKPVPRPPDTTGVWQCDGDILASVLVTR